MWRKKNEILSKLKFWNFSKEISLKKQEDCLPTHEAIVRHIGIKDGIPKKMSEYYCFPLKLVTKIFLKLLKYFEFYISYDFCKGQVWILLRAGFCPPLF